MSVSLEFASIGARYELDVAKFKGPDPNTERPARSNITYVSPATIINIKDKTQYEDFVIKTKAYFLTHSGIAFETFDYSHDVPGLEIGMQENLWLIRTHMFYQILAIVSEMITNETFFNEIYGIFEEASNPDRPSVSPQLDNFF
jgi:hypothetical protein